MKPITSEYYCARATYLPPEALEEIIQSRETIKNAAKTMAGKYNTSTRRIYEIWNCNAKGLSLRKQRTFHFRPDSQGNVTSSGQVKKKSKSICKAELISGGNSMTANPDNYTEKISGKELDALYEQKIRKNEEVRAKMASIVNNT